MDKFKILVTGKNKSIIDDFFIHIDFECQSTSMRYDDIMCHVRYFKPDAFVYCIQDEDKEDVSRMVIWKEKFIKKEIPFIIIGDQEDCDAFERSAYKVADLVLRRPITVTAIQNNISRFLTEIKMEKEEREKSFRQMQDELLKKSESKKRRHILVIDDDVRMLKAVKGHLEDKYDVATAISGALAYKFLEKKKTDLILLDYKMPGESGPEVFAKLQADSNLKSIPVIFLTGVDDMKKVHEVLKLKPQGYLLKPIDHDKLLRTIDEALQQGGTGV